MDANKPISARKLLTWDEAKLREFLVKNNDTNETFEAVYLSDLKDLGSSERDKLRLKIQQLSNLQGVNSDALFSKLAELIATNNSNSVEQSNNNNNTSNDAPISGSPSTPDTISEHTEEYEASCCKALQNDHARLICSHQTLQHLQSTCPPQTYHDQIIPWLTCHPNTKAGAEQISILFSKQLDRWIEFRLWQLLQRGGQDASGRELARLRTLSSSKLRHLGLEQVDDSVLKDLFKGKFPKRKAEPFSRHRSAVQKMAKELGLKKRISLHQNIRQQSSWEDWLEYTRFEQLDLNRLTKELQTKDELSFYSSYNNLYDASLLSLQGISTGHNEQPKSSSIDGIEPANDLDTVGDPASMFIEETQGFVYERQRVYFQTRRVDWAIQEARALETELTPSRTTPKRKAATPTEPQAKRARV